MLGVLLVIGFSQLISAESPTALGEGFYLPETDLVGTIPSGTKIFENLPETCVEERKIGKTAKDEHFYKDTSSFYKSVASETKVEPSLQTNFALGLTLDVTTKHISSNEREVSGSSLKLRAQRSKRIIQKNCLLDAKFNPKFIKDFENLEEKINEPWLKPSWSKYSLFLQKYGSHVVTGIVYGSSIQQYIFANSSKGYSQKDFSVKSCASLTGPAGAAALGIKSCADLSKEEISKTSSMSTTESIVVTGGSDKTRNQVRNKDRTKEMIDTFLDEGYGDATAGPIHIQATPIWDILQDSNSGNDKNLVRAMNLEYFFNGYLNFGCNYIKVKNVEVQRFDVSPDARPGRPGFVCKLAGEGCRNTKDCHYSKSKFKCSCKGSTCVMYKDDKLNTGAQKKVAFINDKHKVPGKGCAWSLSDAECTCQREEDAYPATFSWKSSDYRDVLEDEENEDDDANTENDENEEEEE